MSKVLLMILDVLFQIVTIIFCIVVIIQLHKSKRQDEIMIKKLEKELEEDTVEQVTGDNSNNILIDNIEINQ